MLLASTPLLRRLLCLLLLVLLHSSIATDDANTLQAKDTCGRDSDCENGGSCNLADKFTEFNHCICKNGHEGTNCERLCPLDCANEGSCRPSIDQEDPHNTNYECVCRGQWTGDTCQIPFQVCNDHTMCMHGGSCKLINNITHVYGCNCPFGFDGGPTCSLNPNSNLADELEEIEEEVMQPKVIFALVFGILIALSCTLLIARSFSKRRGYHLKDQSMRNSTDGAFDKHQLHEDSLHSLNLEVI
jgi:hypothetical protein